MIVKRFPGKIWESLVKGLLQLTLLDFLEPFPSILLRGWTRAQSQMPLNLNGFPTKSPTSCANLSLLASSILTINLPSSSTMSSGSISPYPISRALHSNGGNLTLSRFHLHLYVAIGLCSSLSSINGSASPTSHKNPRTS